jgi:hypothetical protein
MDNNIDNNIDFEEHNPEHRNRINRIRKMKIMKIMMQQEMKANIKENIS